MRCPLRKHRFARTFGEFAVPRAHRSMKRRAITPVQRTGASQQKQCDAFRTEYPRHCRNWQITDAGTYRFQTQLLARAT